MRRLWQVLAAAIATWALAIGPSYAGFTPQQFTTFGHLNEHNGTLLPGCHRSYYWSYSIYPPRGYDWQVNLRVIAPGGKQVASDALIRGADPLNGRKYYMLCSAVAPRGEYTLLATMTLTDQINSWTGHLPVWHFWLR